MEAERRSLAAAKRVVVIGGGNVGMETAGDVFDTFPNKELIIVVRSTLFRKSGPAAGPLGIPSMVVIKSRRSVLVLP